MVTATVHISTLRLWLHEQTFYSDEGSFEAGCRTVMTRSRISMPVVC